MKKAHLLWLIFGIIALLFLIGAASVQPGRPISQHPRVTVLQGTDIIPIARTNVSPATNMGLTGNILSNFISLVATQNIRIEAGTNVIITTNVSGQQVTYSISVTNTGSAVADGVWTNDAGIIYPKVSNGQQTNSIQVYTNGGLSIGANTLAYWGTQPGADGETMVSSRASTDDPYNEIFLRYLDGTNELHQDFFMQTGINLWTISFNDMQMRAEVDSASNYVFRATSGSDHVWRFNPASGDRYTFDTPFPVAASEALVEFGNKGTNKLTLYGGDGNLNVVGQITNQFLSASKLVKTDADKGLVSSTLDESGITNLVSTTATNNVKVTAGTNIVVVTNVSGSVVTYNINSTSSSLGGALTPGVLDVASAPVIVIDLALTNTPVVVLTNAPAHVITLVVSNPAPGRWFSFYADGNGGITNNAIGWGGVDGLLLKWLDASTNSIIVSNGFVSVAGYIAQTASRTNLVITHRHE